MKTNANDYTKAGRLAVAVERARRELAALDPGAKQPVRDAKRVLSFAERALADAVADIIANEQ